MAKRLKIAMCVAFLAVLMVPGLAVALSPRFPQFATAMLSNPNSFPTEFEALRRSTPFFNRAIGLYNTAFYKLGMSANPDIMVAGTDGYMFLGDRYDKSYSQATRRLVASDQDVNDWIDVLASEVEFARRRGIQFIFVVAPSQPTIYSDKWIGIPDGFRSRPSTFDRLLEAARARNLPLLDTRADLVAARSTAETYSRLNAHWTDYGAWVAWQRIAAEIAKYLPGTRLAAVGGGPKITITDHSSEARGMLSINAENPWTTAVFEPPLLPFLLSNTNGQPTEVPGDHAIGLLDMPIESQSPHATADKRVLFIRDSMGTALSRFVTASFSNVYNASSYTMQVGLPGLIEEYKPDLILQVMTERSLIYPLGDKDFWRSVNGFDTMKQSAEYRWPSQTNPLVFNGKADLTANGTITVPGGRLENGGVVKLTLSGEGEGGLLFAYYTGSGQPFQRWVRYSKGSNNFYFDLPSSLRGNIYLARDPAGAGGVLQSVDLKVK